MSIGNEPTATRRAAPRGRADARRGLPAWAQRPAPAGAPAVEAVGAALRGLEVEGWRTLDGRHLAGLPAADAGHVVVGPGGIVVVGVLPWPEADDSARRVAAVVTALLAPRHRSAVRVCAVVDGTTEVGPPREPRGEVGLGSDALLARLRALPPRLHPADVEGLAAHLDLHLGGSRLDVLTTAALETDERVARRRVVRPLTADRPVASGHPPASGRRRAPGPAALPWDPAAPARDGITGGPVVRRDLAVLALRAGVVVSTAWLAWVFTTAPLGLG